MVFTSETESPPVSYRPFFLHWQRELAQGLASFRCVQLFRTSDRSSIPTSLSRSAKQGWYIPDLVWYSSCSCGTRRICMMYVVRVSWVGSVPCKSCTTSHNGRWGTRLSRFVRGVKYLASPKRSFIPEQRRHQVSPHGRFLHDGQVQQLVWTQCFGESLCRTAYTSPCNNMGVRSSWLFALQVHACGGMAALAMAVLIGPRLGRFSESETFDLVEQQNAVMQVLWRRRKNVGKSWGATTALKLSPSSKAFFEILS